jgi:pimeloyl-ACP methyl ester carboxylesterase
MLHASPASSVSLVGLVAGFASGRECIAPDTLGNGDSAAPAPPRPDAAYYADASLRVMSALGVGRVDLYGSHTRAHIAVEMAIRAPGRIRRVILDGIGSQFHWAWHFVRDQGWFFPYFKGDAAHLRGIDAPSPDVLHTITLEVLKVIGTYHLAYRAAFAHDDAGRLPLVGRPTLVVADDSDPLKAGVDRAAALLRDARKRVLATDHSRAAQRAKAAVLAEFLDAL